MPQTCSQCQASVDDGATFCPQCGARLADGVNPAAPNSTNTDAAPRERFVAAGAAATRRGGPEVELWTGTYSTKAMIPTFVFVGVLSVVLIAIGALAAAVGVGLGLAAVALLWIWAGLVLAYRRMSIKYRLTSQRFYHETGILRRVTNRLEVIEMDDISHEQGLIERMLGIGTIKVISSDRSHPELVLRGIDDVKRVASILDDAMRSERRNRGLYVESM